MREGDRGPARRSLAKRDGEGLHAYFFIELSTCPDGGSRFACASLAAGHAGFVMLTRTSPVSGFKENPMPANNFFPLRPLISHFAPRLPPKPQRAMAGSGRDVPLRRLGQGTFPQRSQNDFLRPEDLASLSEYSTRPSSSSVVMEYCQPRCLPMLRREP